MPIANSYTPGTAFAQPLSESQKEIWFSAQVSDAACAAFNQSGVLELAGGLDASALSDTLDELVARHDALRTTFSVLGEEQRVHEDLPLFCPVVDLSVHGPAEQKAKVESRLRSEVQTPFDLTKGPMIRAALMKLAAAKHLLVITVHHLICDGTSLNLLLEELAEQYSARAKAGSGAGEKARPMQFSEFVAQERESGSKRSEAEKYWVAQFETPPTFLELPTDYPRLKVRTFRGGGGFLRLDEAVAQEFRRMAAKNRCTLFAASLAAFYVLMHRLSGQTDLVVGVPISVRLTEGSNEVVGHCVNFLPLRIRLTGNPTFTEHLGNVRGMLLDALDHVDYNFGSLIQKLNLPRHPTRGPLVSTMFNVDHIRKDFEWEGLEVELRSNPFCLTNFDFSLSLEDHGGRLEAHCLHSADMFEAATIGRWLRHFEMVLRGAAANPQCRIGELPLLTAAEQELLVNCSGTEEHLIRDLLPKELAALTRPGTAGLEMYVLDAYGQFAVPGVAGELCIAGLPLSEIALPDAKLLNNPARAHDGNLLFRTGYRAKYLGNGDVEILDAVRPVESAPAEIEAAPRAACSGVQSKLTEIWREVMGLDSIEPTDDFFDLGGHSLLITQIVARVRATFAVQLSLRDFFEAPTIRDLAGMIEQQIMQEVQQLPEIQADRLAEALAVA